MMIGENFYQVNARWPEKYCRTWSHCIDSWLAVAVFSLRRRPVLLELRIMMTTCMRDRQVSTIVSTCFATSRSPGIPVPVWRPVPAHRDKEEMRRSARGKLPEHWTSPEACLLPSPDPALFELARWIATPSSTQCHIKYSTQGQWQCFHRNRIHIHQPASSTLSGAVNITSRSRGMDIENWHAQRKRLVCAWDNVHRWLHVHRDRYPS